jgi:acetyl-CoA carboxylase carboxyl transferase subunit alpha
MVYDLEFEKPLAELEQKIIDLQNEGDCLLEEGRQRLHDLQNELERCTRELYIRLSSWETLQVVRHKDRPYAADYIRLIFDDFFELHGDRLFKDDPAIVAGLASLNGQTVMIICNQKGRDTKEKILRNSGMPHPEGYRKAHRLMRKAASLGIAVITFIDTSGASIMLEDEERGQASSIAENLSVMLQLQTPIIATIIGEGGSGGALALGVADRLLMLEHTTYSVAAPEAAASILCRDSKFASEMAHSMRISAKELKFMDIADEVVPEPLGGAHRDHEQAARNLKAALLKNLEELQQIPSGQLLENRYRKYRFMGMLAGNN